jgi:hypothetical protein
LRGFLPLGKADDAGGLSPAKEDNDAERQKDRKDGKLLAWNQYKLSCYKPIMPAKICLV